MRILHTSDWHLGKTLEGYSRLAEQEEFIEELCSIVENNNVDFIILAGDVYDTTNPKAAAEKLFYKALMRLNNSGKRPVLVISGNHDSPDRLMAVSPLASELGIIIVGTPKTIIQKGNYEFYKIVDSGEGYIEIEVNGEKIIAINMAYPSEKTLNEVMSDSNDEKEIQKSYSDKIVHILNNLSNKFREDTINVITGHFYLLGGETEDSERDISLGGTFSVSANMLPENAQYIAMGHLHRRQSVKSSAKHVYYSGSPIQYSKSEITRSKCVYMVDIVPNQEAIVEKIYLRNYKPIEVWKTENIESAIELCKNRKNDNCFVYLEIKTDRVLTPSEIRELRTTKPDIVEILPILTLIGEKEEKTSYVEKSIIEEFKDFYTTTRKLEPNEETTNLFLSLSQHLEDFEEMELD